MTVSKGIDGGGGLVAKSFQTLATTWTGAHQALLSVRFPRQEYCCGLPFPSPWDLPDPGIEPVSPAWQVVFCIAGRFFTAKPPHTLDYSVSLRHRPFPSFSARIKLGVYLVLFLLVYT